MKKGKWKCQIDGGHEYALYFKTVKNHENGMFLAYSKKNTNNNKKEDKMFCEEVGGKRGRKSSFNPDHTRNLMLFRTTSICTFINIYLKN
jgi:hypothetical protein